MPSLGQGHLGWIKVLDTFFFGGLDKFAITYKVIFKLPAESVQKFLMKKAVWWFPFGWCMLGPRRDADKVAKVTKKVTKDVRYMEG